MRKYTIPNKKYKMRVNKQVCEYKIPTLHHQFSSILNKMITAHRMTK